jgi:hypothetical protein
MVKTKDHNLYLLYKITNFYKDIPDMLHFYLRFTYWFFSLYVCLAVRASVC